MQGITEFEDTQAGKRQFTKVRRDAETMLQRANKNNRLGLSRGETHFLGQIMAKSTFAMPWTWVQQGTQTEWAQDWGMSERTLKRYLKRLRGMGILLDTVAAVDRGIRSKALREGYEFPIWTISPVFLELISNEYDHDMWLSSGEAEGVLQEFAETFRKAFEVPTDTPFWESYKCHFGTYRSPLTRIPRPGSDAQMPVIPRGNEDSHIPLDTPPITISSSTHRHAPSNRVRRRLRRAPESGDRVDTDERMDAMPMNLGGPSTSAEDPAPQRKVTTTTEIAEHFQSEWAAMGPNLPIATSLSLPTTPWSDGSKTAFMSWVKKTFLPDHDGDVELCKAMITEYCKQPGPFHTASQRPPWRRFAGMQTKMRQKAHKAGFRTESERELEEAERVEREEREAANRERLRQAREQREAAERKPSVALIEDTFDIDPSDY